MGSARRNDRGLMIETFAAAKINLALHVTGRRADGYHQLDSIVAFATIGDRLRLQRAAEFSLRLEGPFSAGLEAGEDNLALAAAQALVRRWPRHFGPVRITLEKNLPLASGIGGGSADAAAVLRAMMFLHGHHPPQAQLHALALELGADVPVCLSGRACRMEGIGERLAPLPGLPLLWGVLANPGVAVSTAEVFARLGLKPGQEGAAPLPEEPLRAAKDAQRAITRLAALRNDLQAPACALEPAIDACLAALAALPGARLVRMSGSGATCFALFAAEREARAASTRLRAAHPAWWVQPVIIHDAEDAAPLRNGEMPI